MSTPSSPSPPPPPPLDARGLPLGYVWKPEHEVTPREAAALLARPASDPARPLLLDCRRDDELAICSVKGATHIPMDKVEARLDELEDDRGGRGHAIVVMCHHGVRSLKVTLALRAHGFSNVRSMAGGIDLWAMDVDKSMARY